MYLLFDINHIDSRSMAQFCSARYSFDGEENKLCFSVLGSGMPLLNKTREPLDITATFLKV